MNAIKKERFDCLCRTCMHEVEELVVAAAASMAGETKQAQWQSIFDYVAECGALRIAELLTNTTPQLSVQATDELPKKICKECLEQLLSVHRFQQMCIRSDQQMRGLIEYGAIEAKLTQVIEVSGVAPDTVETAAAGDVDPLQSGASGGMEADALVTSPVEVMNYLKMELNDKDDDSDGTKGVAEDALNKSVPLKTEQEPEEEEKAEETSSTDSNDDPNDDSDWAGENGAIRRKPRRCKKEPILDNQQQSTATTKENHTKVAKGAAEDNAKEAASSIFPCPQCSKVFSKLRYLRKHTKRHVVAALRGKEKPSAPLSYTDGYTCDECPRRFIKPESLYKHRQTHNTNATADSEMPAEEYKCDVCSKLYSSQRILTKHKRTHEISKCKTALDVPKPYVCKYCNKAFQQSCTLKDHVRTHTGEQPYLCSECGKAFNSSSNMKQHLLRHTGVKRYECPECPKKFPCLSDLASHKAVHQKVKPHICDVCGAAFGKPYQLKKHKMYHSGDKPHKCEYCEMRFVCADHMRRHMRTHTGEKPYKCKYCERAFAQSNDLIKHLRSHLGDNVYKCELCPRAFRLATELREHFTVHKNDDAATRESNLKALLEEDARLRMNMVDRAINYNVAQQQEDQHGDTNFACN